MTTRIHTYPQARANANMQLPFHFQAPQNGNYSSNYPLVPVERGPVAMKSRNHDFFHNQWGVPDDLAQMMQSNPNIQPLDLIAQYKGRALVIPSQHITAALLNAEASFLSEIVAPMFPTTEFNFESSVKEMNQVEFTRIAAGGVPNQQTFRTTTWKDTIQKMQLDAEIELQYALDPLVGEEMWLFQLAGIANNAMLTIHKTIGYAVVSIAYGNLLGQYVKKGPGDLAKLLMATEDYFAIAARDNVKYYRMIQRFAHLIRGLDLVLTEFGTTCYVNELLGESESMRGQKTILDPTTGDLMWRFTQGKKSIGTMNYGELKIHFAEIPNLRVNMDDDNHEQPLRTSVTLAEVYPPNPNNKASDTIVPRASNLDIEIYEQRKTHGDIVKVSIVDAYEAAFYFGRDGYPSNITKDFCLEKNQQIMGNDSLTPWEYNPLNAQKDKDLMDFNADSPYDNDKPNMDYVRGKETLEAMRGWRDRFFGVTYVPSLKLFKIPKRIGDFERWAIPDSRILQCAKTITSLVSSSHNVDFNSMIQETHDLLDDIDNTPFTLPYLRELREANRVGVSSFARNPNTTPFKKAAKLVEWAANENGSLNLPQRDGKQIEAYPAGFGFGGGLVTLAKEADKPESQWKVAGARAKKVVLFWEIVAEFIEQYIGKSDIIDASLTAPHFQVESRITVLIDSTRHHTAPVFIRTADAVAFTADAKAYGVLDAFTGSDVLSRALKEIIDDRKKLRDRILAYIEGKIVDSRGGSILKQLSALTYIAAQLAFVVKAGEKEKIALLDKELLSYMATSTEKEVTDAARKSYEANVKPMESAYADSIPKVNAYLLGAKDDRSTIVEWARAPLVSGNRIFTVDKEVQAIIRPADPYKFYEKPYLGEPVEGDLYNPVFAFKSKFSRNQAVGLSGLPYSHIYKQGLGINADSSSAYNAAREQQQEQDQYGRTDFFNESLVSKKTRSSRAMDVSGFLASGSGFSAPRDYADMDVEEKVGGYRGGFEKKDAPPVVPVFAGRRGRGDTEGIDQDTYNQMSKAERKEIDNKMNAHLEQQVFFGPWRGRFNYMNKTVHSPIHKVFFLAILMAHNSIDIHNRLASIGLKLVNVLIFRLFIQHIMSSTIVMKSLTSIQTAISRTTVFSSMEKRGIITINGGFYLGVIRRNPLDIQMMPYTHPVGFVGGMGVDFLRQPAQFRHKVNEKPSMIAILSPITESVYEYPIHFLGLPTFTRRDRDNAMHNRKWSSCEFAKFVFGDSSLYDAEAHIKDHKQQHGFSYDVSFCVARGCTRYQDATDPHYNVKMIPGTGARADPCMNSTTSWKTFMGDSIKFPEYAYDHQLRV